MHRIQQFLASHQALHPKNSENLLIEKERMEAINDLVETLSPQRRLIFKMRYFEGKDNGMIAEQMQISINTVKVHLVKARHHLKKQLAINDDNFLATLSVLAFMLQ